MFFAFTRFMQHLVLPPACLLFLMIAGFLIVKKKRALGLLCIAAGFILLYGLSLDPVSEYLITPLETSHPPLRTKSVQASAIVVLSGGVRDLAWVGLEPEPSGASLERTVAGVTLYRTQHVPLIFVGGSGDPTKQGIGEAPAMARIARDLGVPDKDVVVQATARNTVESAQAMKEKIAHSRIILVTSAFHMKRSVALFKKQGFDVVPAPIGYLAEQRPISRYSFIPGAGALGVSSIAVSEYLSFGWYLLKGDL